MMETLRLLSTPANAARLMQAVDHVNSGKFELHDLIEPEVPVKGTKLR